MVTFQFFIVETLFFDGSLGGTRRIGFNSSDTLRPLYSSLFSSHFTSTSLGIKILFSSFTKSDHIFAFIA